MKIIKIGAIWCPGCLVMKKVWKEIEKEYPNIEYVNYDYDINQSEIEKYNIGQILPVIIFINKNKEKKLVGEKTKKEIIEVIEGLM